MQNEHNWRNHREELRHAILHQRFGLISDFDGTLSPFVSQPNEASISQANAYALDGLADIVTVIGLVSGRSASDLRTRYQCKGIEYYGNHGLEAWRGGSAAIAPAAEAWIQPLNTLIDAIKAANLPGVMVENKRLTASVHYYPVPDADTACHQLEEALTPLVEKFGFRLNPGRMLWEIKPPISIHKGTAVQSIIDDFNLTGTLFLGDDVTDFNAMNQIHELVKDPKRGLCGLSVGVLHPTSPCELVEMCDVTADGVADVAELLDWVLAERSLALSHS